MENTILRAVILNEFVCELETKNLYNEISLWIDANERWNYATDFSLDIQHVFNKVLVHVGVYNDICGYNIYLDITKIDVDEYREDIAEDIFKIYKQIATLGCLSINMANRLQKDYNAKIEYNYSYLEITGEAKVLE